MTNNSTPRFLVIGALHVDEVATAKAPIITGESNPVSWARYAGGVAANLARSAANHTNASVILLANIGADKDANDLASALANTGVDVKPMRSTDSQTGRYSAIVQNDGSLLVGLADVEQAQAITLADVKKIIDLKSADAVVLDTNLSAAALSDITNEIRCAYTSCLICALGVSPSKIIRLKPSLTNVDILFCNELEANALANGYHTDELLEPSALLSRLSNLGCKHIVMTCGTNNVEVYSGHEHSSIEVPKIDSSSTVNGPGDALAGATLSEILQGSLTHQNLVQTVTHAGIPAAANVVTGVHTAPALK